MLRSVKRTFLKNLSTNFQSLKQFWSVYHSLSINHQRIPPLLTNCSHTVESPYAKANMLNSYFISNFSTNSNLPSSMPSSPAVSTLSEISCSSAEVYQLLKCLKIKTASGPDAECFEDVSPPLSCTYLPFSTCPSLLASFPLLGKLLTSHQYTRMVTPSRPQTITQFLFCQFRPNFSSALSITNL